MIFFKQGSGVFLSETIIPERIPSYIRPHPDVSISIASRYETQLCASTSHG